jgi:radical SAM superfamily enzyme YgiQ (UPF0313 family)
MPAEPPSGAFMLASGLAGAGIDTGLLDLSLEFFWRVFTPANNKTEPALEYLLKESDGYEPQRHRSSTGVLHKSLQRFNNDHQGWKLTLMDIQTPARIHDPQSIVEALQSTQNPFTPLWRDVVGPKIAEYRPKRVLISLAYLSQLAATIDLVGFLKEQGLKAIVGGSLPTSLARTGLGLKFLADFLPNIITGDGRELTGSTNPPPLLSRLSWPRLLSKYPYLSSRPIIPLSLSTGCFWRQCLFCPDREAPFTNVPIKAIENFLSTMPTSVRSLKPVIHLLDSAVPPSRLRRFLPLATDHNLRFYGFARPTARLMKDNLLEDAADSGLTMLQLGVESGSGQLLERFDKGIDPIEAERVVRTAADLGIRTYLYLLFGLPSENDKDRRDTADFLLRNAKSVDFLNLSLFNLPRYCELADRADEFGIEMGSYSKAESIQLYRPFTCNDISVRDEARRFIEQHIRGNPIIKEAVLRTPRWLRAAHLALMKIEGRRAP